VHHVGILYGQFMMHGQRNIKLLYHVCQPVLLKLFRWRRAACWPALD